LEYPAYTDASDLNYWSRFVLDITFFIIVIVLILNIVFGIIIDAFAGMRDAEQSILEDLEGVCFICGINKSEFDTK
jgi:hypothetical protein